MATAIAAGVGSILGGVLGGKGAAKAAKIQAKAYQQGLQQQQQQYETTRSDFAPYREGGIAALRQFGDLIGLDMPGIISGYGGGTFDINGNPVTTSGYDADGNPITMRADGSVIPDPQQAAIERLKAMPGFQSQYGIGVDTVLQNASATGGVRGGNVNNTLAQFGSGLLAQVIQQQLGNLGGIIGFGSNAASQGAQLGQQNANAQSELLIGKGNANATRAAAPYQAAVSVLQGLGQAFGGGFGGGKAPAIPGSAGGMDLRGFSYGGF